MLAVADRLGKLGKIFGAELPSTLQNPFTTRKENQGNPPPPQMQCVSLWKTSQSGHGVWAWGVELWGGQGMCCHHTNYAQRVQAHTPPIPINLLSCGSAAGLEVHRMRSSSRIVGFMCFSNAVAWTCRWRWRRRATAGKKGRDGRGQEGGVP